MEVSQYFKAAEKRKILQDAFDEVLVEWEEGPLDGFPQGTFYASFKRTDAVHIEKNGEEIPLKPLEGATGTEALTKLFFRLAHLKPDEKLIFVMKVSDSFGNRESADFPMEYKFENGEFVPS